MIDGIGDESNSFDRVSGYTIRQLEDALLGADTWNEWRDNISRYNNSTAENLTALFNAWNN